MTPARLRPRASLRAALALGAVPAVALLAGPALAAPSPARDPGSTLLPAPAHGRAALISVGSDLERVAARNGLTSSRLATTLRTDPTMWLDVQGRLQAKDPAPPGVAPAAVPASTAEAGPTTAQTEAPEFLLHSRPGSDRVIYLDFRGESGLSSSAWSSATLDDSQPPFDADGDPTTFSPTELADVQSVFERVAEDYATFDVDVTTQDPGTEALTRSSSNDPTFGTRALITSSTNAATAICNNSCGGVAYVGTFDSSSTYQPAWIFPQLLGNDAKNIAEAVSHEVGHNLGLLHDGTSAVGYYSGQGDWAPIMGVGYYQPVVQWSKGEYTDANNTQDDFAVMTSNGVDRLADDIGDTRASATKLGAAATLSGLIGTDADVDVVSVVQECQGDFTASADPSAVSPDLDIRLRLLAADGTVLADDDPASAAVNRDVATGLAAGVTSPLAPGTYYLEVDGVGSADPATTGYSDYASVGPYTLSVTRCVAPPPPPPPPPPPHRNLVRDAGFETDANGDGRPDQWRGDASFSRVAVAHHDGTHAASLSARDNRTHRVTQTVTGVTAGASYRAGAWVNLRRTHDRFTFAVTVQWRTAAGRLLRTDVLHRWRHATAGWRPATRTLTAPSGARRARVVLVATSLRTRVFADGILLRRI